jgi:hypothetical protein
MINKLLKNFKSLTKTQSFNFGNKHAILLKGGSVVNADFTEKADVLIANGKI